jgi:alanine racemase
MVDLDVLTGNVRALRRLVAPNSELMAVVKADGYGHGAIMVARTALAAGAASLAVATVAEGVQLRAAGIAAPILTLGAIAATEADIALSHGLAVTVATSDLLNAISAAARRLKLPLPVAIHVKVDTGMRRYGATPALAVALAQRVASDPYLHFAGLSTHFAVADEPDERFTLDQAAMLEQCRMELAALGIRPARVHLANSAATLRSSRYHFDLVRVGIALYGLPPARGITLPPDVRPALTVRGRIARLIDLAPGDTVGYGRTYTVDTHRQAALVPIGYADGYRRGLSGVAWMGWQGARAPVLGRVSMDQTVIAVPAGVLPAIGDEVTVFGGTGEEGAPSTSELAELLGTISYEVVTGITDRVPHLYTRGGEIVATASSGVFLDECVPRTPMLARETGNDRSF